MLCFDDAVNLLIFNYFNIILFCSLIQYAVIQFNINDNNMLLSVH